MTIKIYYDASQSDGGSPFWASHRKHDRIADNAIVCLSQVEDDADDTDWETPCAQNSVEGFVLISGPHDFYDVVVRVAGRSPQECDAPVPQLVFLTKSEDKKERPHYPRREN